MLNIKTHQDLLEAWVNAEISNIHEWSSNITSDIEEVTQTAIAYAHDHGLAAKEEWFNE
jgi:hypothetical protein